MLTTVLANELRERRAQIENIDISQVNLEMTHIHDVTINYDYLIELIARMADEVHEDKMDQAELTKMRSMLKLQNRIAIRRLRKFAILFPRSLRRNSSLISIRLLEMLKK